MANKVFRCINCGAVLPVTAGETICTCEYCDSIQTISFEQDNTKKKLYDTANDLRIRCEFDRALHLYEEINIKYGIEHEASWGIVLSKYGIEFVHDNKTGHKVPTCHRTQFTNITDDRDYINALQNSNPTNKRMYEAKAKMISKIQKGILKVYREEKPYDIFICYKETDDNGERTKDSVLAQDIYDDLTDKGYRVFFSRITLENKLGIEYEPYIFAALTNARLMILVTTSIKYVESTWVRNEWSRFVEMRLTDRNKFFISCYKGLDPNKLPNEINGLQSIDMSKIGAKQDLYHGIEKLIGAGKNKIETPTKVIQTKVVETKEISKVDNLLKRVKISIEDNDFETAREIIDDILNLDAENSKAYSYLTLIELNVTNYNSLINSCYDFTKSRNFKHALEFAKGKEKTELENYVNKLNAAITKKANKEKIDKYNAYAEDINKMVNYLVSANKYGDAIKKLLDTGDPQIIGNRPVEIVATLYAQFERLNDLSRKETILGRLQKLVKQFPDYPQFKEYESKASEFFYLDVKKRLNNLKISNTEYEGVAHLYRGVLYTLCILDNYKDSKKLLTELQLYVNKEESIIKQRKDTLALNKKKKDARDGRLFNLFGIILIFLSIAAVAFASLYSFNMGDIFGLLMLILSGVLLVVDSIYIPFWIKNVLNYNGKFVVSILSSALGLAVSVVMFIAQIRNFGNIYDTSNAFIGTYIYIPILICLFPIPAYIFFFIIHCAFKDDVERANGLSFQILISQIVFSSIYLFITNYDAISFFNSAKYYTIFFTSLFLLIFVILSYLLLPSINLKKVFSVVLNAGLMIVTISMAFIIGPANGKGYLPIFIALSIMLLVPNIVFAANWRFDDSTPTCIVFVILTSLLLFTVNTVNSFVTVLPVIVL